MTVFTPMMKIEKVGERIVFCIYKCMSKIVDFIKKNFSYIVKSLQDGTGKISSARISSYYILAGILFLCIIFGAIEVGNAIVYWKDGNEYIIPAAHITIFGMILTHHLILLGLKKASEKDQLRFNGNNDSMSDSQSSDSQGIQTGGAADTKLNTNG